MVKHSLVTIKLSNLGGNDDLEVSKMSLRFAIVGFGVVGKSMKLLLPDAVVYDTAPGMPLTILGGPEKDTAEAAEVYGQIYGLSLRISRDHTLVFPSSPGFGGKCLPKDLSALISAAEKAGHDSDFLRMVKLLNGQFQGGDYSTFVQEPWTAEVSFDQYQHAERGRSGR